MFSNYIISSPSIWFDDYSLLSIKPTQPTQPIKIYIGVGSLEKPEYGEGQDMVVSAEWLTKKLKTDNWPNLAFKSVVINGASHSTSFPTSSIQGLDWLYGKDPSDF